MNLNEIAHDMREAIRKREEHGWGIAQMVQRPQGLSETKIKADAGV